MADAVAHSSRMGVSCFQTGRSQLRRYKAKKLLVSEGEASQPTAHSQVLEFWLVREYCDKGSLSVRFLHSVSPCLLCVPLLPCPDFQGYRALKLMLALRSLCCMGFNCIVNATMSDTESLVCPVYANVCPSYASQAAQASRQVKQSFSWSKVHKQKDEHTKHPENINKHQTYCQVQHHQARNCLAMQAHDSS